MDLKRRYGQKWMLIVYEPDRYTRHQYIVTCEEIMLGGRFSVLGESKVKIKRPSQGVRWEKKLRY